MRKNPGMVHKTMQMFFDSVRRRRARGAVAGPVAPSTPSGSFLASVFTLALMGCAAPPGSATLLSAADDQGKPAARAAGSASAQGSGLTQDVLYKLLVAEFAGRRGQLPLSLTYYLDVARQTRQPEIAERAVRIAVFARDKKRGLEAASLWTELAPENTDAQQVYAALLLRAGRVDEAVEVLDKLVVALEGQRPGLGFSRVADMLAREKDKRAALTVMERITQAYPDNAKAQSAYGELLARSDELDRALQVFEKVMELDPGDEQAVVIYARILQRQSDTNGALDALSRSLEARPDSQVVRMTYARLLVDAKRYDDAREQFERLAKDAPDNVDVKYALALLLMQTNRFEQAEAHLQELTFDVQRRYAAYYYLGQIAENQKRTDDALAAYRKVDRGEHRLNAQIRSAVLIAQKGDIDEARAHLHGLRGHNNQEAIRLYRAEAEILVREDLLDEAMLVYDAAVAEFPRHADLLYARAMLGERLNRLDVVERDLRDILSREPNNADALNALGYTLADRTDRLEEAYELIKQAYELKPEDHYIVDSLGWVLYRMGNHQEALVYLRQAMALQADPEIAAHLGEVLWVTGNREAAMEVWDTALQTTPDDKKLLDTKRRFGL